jgi:hypothetical protein
MFALKRSVSRATLRQRVKSLAASTAKILRFPGRQDAREADPARRRLMAGTIAVAALVPLPAFGGGDGNADELDTLWRRWRAETAFSNELSRKWKEAHDSLPWWAAPGPQYLRADGTMDGAEVGWPAIQDMQPPEDEMVRRLIRPGLGDLQQLRQTEGVFGTGEAQARYRRRVRELANRRYAQKLEWRKAGIFEIQQLQDDCCDRSAELEEEIKALPPSLPALAARLLIEFFDNSFRSDTLADFNETLPVALAALLPLLSGQLAADVADLLADPERPIKTLG